MTCVRLILGDQLDATHTWFSRPDADVVYVMMEMRQETDYVLHHAQKVIAFFAAMRRFAELLQMRGHRVRYLTIDDAQNRQRLDDNLNVVLSELGATRFQYQVADEYRLDAQLLDYARSAPVPVDRIESEHFFTHRGRVREIFGSTRRWRLEQFYRRMRIEHEILTDADGRPTGGRWNFDAANRKPWRGDPPEPPDARPSHDHQTLWSTIQGGGIATFGSPHAERFRWPLDREESLKVLSQFVEHSLRYFGDFQDAMHSRAPRLFHSQLSFALNTKMIHPREVVSAALDALRAGQAPLNAVEGFVRQILGWREFVRGVYWAQMPAYAENNFFEHRRPLPHWFWNGETHMQCLHTCITQSLDQAYAHHIQRLMIIGNFALIAGLDPGEVHRWYLGIYIDAVEWVEMPNTLGLSQFADGGLLASKPYVAASAYIHRMSDYCSRCAYKRAELTGPRACPFNSLYWSFLSQNRRRLGGNPRLALAYKLMGAWSSERLQSIEGQADRIRNHLDDL